MTPFIVNQSMRSIFNHRYSFNLIIKSYNTNILLNLLFLKITVNKIAIK